ncbi:MAG: hypothetical protein GY847_26150 [Proteobacteria bacterium]|nr:hypothetical protein [Pseudomonadota bacterium]
MTNGWNHAETLADKHAGAGSGLFVKLANDRDRVVGIFFGEPYAREVHWTGERYAPCMDNGCQYCEEGKKPSLRVSMNFFVPQENAMKIIEGGVTWFKDVMTVREKYGLGKWSFEIQRHGEAGSSKTTYTILPEEKLSDEQIAEISRLDLNELSKVVTGENSTASNDRTKQEDKLIDPHVASSFVPRLKAMPREALDTFLEKFGVQRIYDLKASDETIALALISNLETKYKTPETSTTEVDPFAQREVNDVA